METTTKEEKKMRCCFVDVTVWKPHIEDYLQHINDMICWEIRKWEALRKSLENLAEYFKNRWKTDKQKAVIDFINHQEEDMLDIISYDYFECDKEDDIVYVNFDFFIR